MNNPNFISIEDINNDYIASEPRFLEELKEFLRFPSISTDPRHDDDCQRCAAWLVQHLSQMGVTSRLLKTSSKPVVYGELLTPGAERTVLFYGHYDVQPVDPLDLWSSNPFSPELRGGRLYARGAQDNKGQLFYLLKALELLVKKNALRCNVKLLIEGEEEHGSEGISEALAGWSDLVKSDVLLVCDTGKLIRQWPQLRWDCVV